MAGDIKLALILRLVDKLTGPMAAVTRKFDGLSRHAKRLSAEFDALKGGLGDIGAGLRTGAGILGGYGAAAGVTAGYLVKQGAAFEKLHVMLTQLEGSGEKADQSLAWIQEFAKNTPLQLTEVQEAFLKLKQFGLEPMDGTLQALVDANALMGGSSEQLQGTILALGQAWTKGKLQGEEAMQSTERMVPVWELLAKATGKNVAELQDLSSEGALGRDVIKRLIEEMGKNAKGAADSQMKTWDGMVSNMIDAWERFTLKISQGGLFDFLKGELAALLERVNELEANGTLERWAREISDNLIEAVRVARDLAGGLVEAVQEISPWIVEAKDLLGGWNELALAVLAIPFAGTLTGIATGVAKLAAAFAASPILLMITAIAGGIYAIYDNWDNIVSYFTEKFDAVYAAFDQGFWQGVMALIEAFDPVQIFADAFFGLVEWLTGYTFQFRWSDLLPDWSWRDIIPDMPDFGIGSWFGGGEEEAKPLRPAGAARGGDVTTNVGGITINAAPGQSEREIAREAVSQMQRGGQAGNQRGPLYDRPQYGGGT